ncbi:hypothetical protein CROQUDRAFT_660562 [Cronartium quercuum f. sp. fusiforme G11]|uniref:Uncharacterized protein n=1 Tax=Cronartium quercuum f. sp. fusiforme G11 TaxID=708437 RepID=A0A9P6NHZ1_9BASI|nr:hypothetical protein CROQUDRAFT_660562 [Cronartium quercuum f. sp. fusiforme G11]
MSFSKVFVLKAILQIPLLLLLCTSLRVSGSKHLPHDPSPHFIQHYNISKRSNVSQTAGELSWGAANLLFDSGAGAGINWHEGFIGGGFNAGSTKHGTPNIGGGWSINETSITWGIGMTWEGTTLSIAINGVKGGKLQVTINNKHVEIPA